MDRAIHSAAAKQRRVGGVHNRVYVLLRDVAGDGGDAVGNGSAGHDFLQMIHRVGHADDDFLAHP